jgi:2-polyprenyl-3-methyl-5-hydroxy-6-metoxy-1,4-benzoquinol methylase
MASDEIRRVIRSFDDPVVRAYSRVRFGILRQRFLDEIGQYLPESGRVLDIGCGFGLFSLYYASTRPGLELRGIDLNERRIGMAREAATRLALRNVEYAVGDAALFRGEEASFDAVYLLDVVHHIPEEAVEPLIRETRRALVPGGRLLVKDVERRPAWKRLFTHALDLAMSPSSPVCYWDRPRLAATLAAAGFRVYSHSMVDFLPYPHVLFVCRKEE